MAETATIFIPDISGYTDFVTKTEIDHSSHILNHLLETIVESISEDFTISEIEGDAVLVYKKGTPPTKKEIINQCVKTFTAFHSIIRGMNSVVLCQCGACQGMNNLTLKFVVHYGNIAEIKVNRFVKASGVDMVIAHRLLKNSIPENEYVLATSSYLDNISDSAESFQLSWDTSEEEYPSIGKIAFDFASLSPVKSEIPEVPRVKNELEIHDPVKTETEINADYRDVYAALINLENRKHFAPGVKRSYQEEDGTFIGSKHYCVFEYGTAEIVPYHLDVKENEIIYAEYASMESNNYFAVYYFDIKSLGEGKCLMEWQVFPQPGHSFSAELRSTLVADLPQIAKSFKDFCENGFQPVMKASTE